jgi:dipeptidyl aminopeptidase/acylaminoacyl peptidase
MLRKAAAGRAAHRACSLSWRDEDLQAAEGSRKIRERTILVVQACVPVVAMARLRDVVRWPTAGRGVSWRRAIAGGLAAVILAAPTAVATTGHDAAYVDGRHPAVDTAGPVTTVFLLATAPGVTGLAFSPDGRLLASGYGDGTVRLWDPATGHLVRALLQSGSASQNSVNGVAFSPDGKLLASGYGDGTVRLWDPATGHLVGAVLRSGSGSRSSVNGVAFSPDGKLLASGYGDGTVRLWTPATGQPAAPALKPVPGPQPGVNAVAFSPDGKLLASACRDGTVRLWTPATGEPAGAPLQIAPGGQGGVNGVAFSPDGKLLASGYGDAVRIWGRSADRSGGLGGFSWLIIAAFVIAIAVSAATVIITAREIRAGSRRLH